MDETVLREVFGCDFDRLVGPAYQGCLLPELFRPHVIPHVRFLGPDDAAMIEAFRVNCGQDAWEYAGFDDATSYLAGILERDRILSLAGYNRVWRDEAGGPCILTHRAHRGRGGQRPQPAPLSGARSRKASCFSIRLLKPTWRPSVLPGDLDMSSTLGMWRYG